MKKINIDGPIGWSVTADDIKQQIDSAGEGEELEITISSSGGFVFDGIQIYNAILNHTGKTVAIINGQAASIASYIAMATDDLLVSDNSVFMIHNASALGWGDYRAMQKMSDVLNGLTDIIGKAYINKTGKSKNNIRGQMDDETWLFGEEIKDQGFADKVIETENTEDNQNSLLAQGKLAYSNLTAKMQKDKIAMQADFDRCSNLFIKNSLTEDKKILKNKESVKNDLLGDFKMTLEELKAKHPELYNEIMSQGIKQGTDQERSRVKSHMEFLNKGISVDYAKEAIANGLAYKDEAMAHYMSAALDKKDLDNRVVESSQEEEIPAPASSTPDNSDPDNSELLAKVLSFSGKKE